MFEAIAQKIESATTTRQRMAMFHFQVLSNAHDLWSVDPVKFCRWVNVPPTYQTEFSKMLRLARVIQEEGMSLS